MRLIHTKSLELHEFFDVGNRKYAILSHTWEGKEVTFQDWLYATNQNPPRWGWVYNKEEVQRIKDSKGYTKIEKACRQACVDGIDWIWVDTNCIDKTNSAELSEAINSMYQWYQRAEVCYAFLSEVSESSLEDCKNQGSKFRRSRWFTRGWTLQELIAPKQLVFYNDSWTRICEKKEISRAIQEITNIPELIIQKPELLGGGHARIVDVMSWASTRTTTRTEDRAYCLMGLFGINMPLLYGEEHNAFVWQQDSLQPRGATENKANLWELSHMDTFAQEPRAFYFSRDIDIGVGELIETPRSLNISNLGLLLRLPLVGTLCPWFLFAVLPMTKNHRALWMPLTPQDYQYIRLAFPSVTLSVPKVGYTVQDSEITLPIYRWDRHYSPDLIVSMGPYSGYGRRSPANILLAFPAGLHGYKLLRKFPPPHPQEQMHDIVLGLCVKDDQPTVAYGAIEFEKNLEPNPSNAKGKSPARVAIFFAVELGYPDSPDPRRWTCRDISYSQFVPYLRENSDSHLESRTRIQLNCLTSPPSNEMVILSWEHRMLLEDESPQADHGIILLDNATCKLAGAESDSNHGSKERDDGNVNSEGSCRPNEVVTVAQIIFPGQGYNGKW